MSIDWITVIAQIGNFLLLVWLLRRFLYRPILRGIDAREAEIARRLDQAERARIDAERAKQTHLDRQSSWQDAQAAEQARLMAEAQRQGDALLRRAQEQSAAERQALREDLARERAEFFAQLELQAAQSLAELLRRALHDLAGLDLEQALLQHGLQRLKARADALRPQVGSGAKATLTTQQPIARDAQPALLLGLRALFPDLDWSLQDNPAQSPGLRIQIGSLLLDWTLDGYVDELQQLMEEPFAARTMQPGMRHV